MPKLVVMVFSCAALIVVYNAVVVIKAAARGSSLAKASEVFTRSVTNPAHSILVVGDSTAVGTGASSPEDSIAGRIAADFSTTAVYNYAQDGALTAAVPAQIARAAKDSYDLILIQVGGNDALRFTRAKNLRVSIDNSLAAATAASQNVLLISVGDLGEAPSVPWPLSLLLSYRSRLVRDVFQEVASRKSVHFLDLLALSKDGSPFKENTQKYYAEDGLHPSSAGYDVWYQNLRSSAPLAQWLGNEDLER